MNSDLKDGGPAFPCSIEIRDIQGELCCEPFHSAGMSLRDWFAGQYLSGVMADHEASGSYEVFAKEAYMYADAFIAARSPADGAQTTLGGDVKMIADGEVPKGYRREPNTGSLKERPEGPTPTGAQSTTAAAKGVEGKT